MNLPSTPSSDGLTALDSDTAPMATWKAHLAAGRFMLQRCDECGRHVFYPRVICPHCASDTLAWLPASGYGTVYSTTVVSRRAEQGGNYNVALIDLEEGVRLMSRVDGIAPEQVAIGMPVRHAIERAEGEAPLLVFKPHG
jgi:uncharacterized OB-fold protein